MDTVIWQILVQVILIALNAFFAASEIAVISLSDVKLRRLAESGDKKAKKMLKMVEDSTGFLSTIQVGITLAGFLGSAFAADGFSGYLVDFLVNTGTQFLRDLLRQGRKYAFLNNVQNTTANVKTHQDDTKSDGFLRIHNPSNRTFLYNRRYFVELVWT